MSTDNPQLFTSLKSANKAGDDRINAEFAKGHQCQTLAKKATQHNPDKSVDQGYKVALWIDHSFVGYL